MNNSTSDKTMEYLRKRIKVRLVNNVGNYKKYINKPSFVWQKVFNKSFVAIQEIKPVLTLDKPIYIVFSILDLSKYLIYEFHYKYIERKCNANLLFTETDSLVYEIETKDFSEGKSLFDFSDSAEDSNFFDPVNKKVIAEKKDEFKRKIISKFVELKSKMNPLVTVDNEEIKKVNGVSKITVKNIRHREYIVVLLNKKNIRHK